MKRRILSSLLAAALLSTSASAAFSDIEDSYTQQAASALAGMGIVSGTGFGKYEPNRLLTRAEFTRLAVGAMGVTNVDNYQSYTIFPDVPAGHWASGWVNAAVRHPDFAENPIIRGLADGTFGPGKATTLGEGCTMALRMLGYEQKDIGPFWPNDYVAKARSLGLLTNLQVTDPNAALTRGSAAVLFRNTLTAQKKDGSPMLSAFSGGTPVEHSVLVSTGGTDSTLTASQATFYENGELVTRQVVGEIDPSVVGSQGVVIFDKYRTDHVRGFLPDQSTSRDILVRQVEPDGLVPDDGTGFIKIPRHTPLVVLGEVHPYGESWFDLNENTSVTLHFDANGIVQTVSASSLHLNYPVLIMGINGSEKNIPAGWKIEKNGKQIRAGQLKQYDVMVLNSASKTVLVSDNRITGLYDDATPTFRYPEQITILGAKLAIPETFATTFKDMEPGDRITVLFDAYGRACAAVSDRRASAKMEGVVIACTDSSVSVQLFNNVTITGTPATRLVENEFGEMVEETGLAQNAVGQQVRVTQNDDGTLNITRVKSTQSASKGNWDIENRMLGGLNVSAKVQVYERVSGTSTPLSPISVYDIPFDIVPADQIISTKQDSSGTVISIVLKDVTGDSWVYGMVKDTTIVTERPPYIDEETGIEITPEPDYDYRVTMTTLLDGKSETREFLLTGSLGSKIRRNNIVGLPASALTNQTRVSLSVQVPDKIGTVYLEAFDGYAAVRTKEGYYPIADDVPVYVKKTGKCITLRQAKANYSSFQLYADKPIDQGGKIRIIVV
ncbi:S-layer homology domain-containing protein [Clostridiaceae bacterium]|nr:S-layer homology domain-containing protein [Clostridiaceae bacterium]